MENKIQGTMNSMLKGNYNIGKHFGSDAKKQVLNDLMIKHGVTTSLDKMKGYKRDAFLKDVERSRMDYYGKKAILEHYGPQKSSIKNNKLSDRRSSYDEIMAKRKTVENSTPKGGGFGIFGFSFSNKKMREAEGKNLIVHADNVQHADDYHKDQHADNYTDDKRDLIDLIRRIQS